MSCIVDAAQWGEKNRVALATGKTQEWVLARTTRDNPTVSILPTTARAVMVKWFGGIPTDVQFADAGSAVDDVQVVSVSETLPVPKASDQRRETLDPIPLLAPGGAPPLYVRLTFNYRGYATSLPWPVWTATASPFRVDKLCPFEADWMLMWARDLSALGVAPDEQSGLDKLSHNAPPLLAGLADITKLAGWGLGLYLGAQVFGLAKTFLPPLSRRRRSST
jgi:hypothetical protein